MTRILLSIIFLYIIISRFTGVTHAAGKGTKVEFRASIWAATYYRIYGYTSPSSIVQATSVRTFAQGISDNSGYFLIEDVPIAPEAEEICISAIDSERRVSFPICISIYDFQNTGEIGPVLLAPTLSISQSQIWQNQTVFASGKTIPNQEVKILFFEVPSYTVSSTVSRKLNMTVYAADLPEIKTLSDAGGNYSISLPTAKALGYRLFARAIYKENPTPKSQTLSFVISPFVEYFIRYWLAKLIMLLILTIILIGCLIYDHRTKKISIVVNYLIGKKLKSIAVRIRLAIRRRWYNFRQYQMSNRK